MSVRRGFSFGCGFAVALLVCGLFIVALLGGGIVLLTRPWDRSLATQRPEVWDWDSHEGYRPRNSGHTGGLEKQRDTGDSKERR